MTVSASASKIKLLSLCALLLLTVALTAFRMYVLYTGEGETAFAVCTFVTCLLLLGVSLAIGKRFSPELPQGLPSVTFGASVTGFLLLTVTVASVYFTFFAPAEDRAEELNPSVAMLVILFALLSAVYFLLLAGYLPLTEKKALYLLLAMAPVLFTALRILHDFIETSTMPLANSGGYHILSMIATMLFFLREAKFLTGVGKTWVFLAVGQIAVLLLAVYNIPLLTSYLAGSGEHTDALYSLMSLGVIGYMLTRLFSLRARCADEVSPAEE